MLLNLHPKCANPSCAAAFDWLAGGKLFRFNGISGGSASFSDDHRAANSCRASGHFWLCEHCSNLYTLRSERGQIVLQPLWPELPAAENKMPLRAS